MMVPPSKPGHQWYLIYDQDQPCAACALGTAAVAAGIGARDHQHDYYDALNREGPLVEAFPILKNTELLKCISWRYESGHYTREQIADWVQSIEDGLSPAAGEAEKVESEPVSVGELIER